MLRRSSLARMQAELGALEASAERAGLALACVYSCSDELVTAEIRARRMAIARAARMVAAMRLLLGATAAAAIIALSALAAHVI
ncbi:MAG TPA: hypothetical protein VFU97_14350 [Xanthobacteraceae bacterium]|nr:hypothetical protein [Xanthobacteraceae bacterium]